MRNVWEKITDIYYNLVYGVANIFIWFPIVWRDRDWDWAWLVKLMEFKLRRMHKNFKKYGRHVGHERDARRMLICAELLKRLSDSEYFDEKTKIWDFDLDYKQEEKLFQFSAKDSALLRRAGRNEDLLENYYIEYCFKLMKKYLRTWWN